MQIMRQKVFSKKKLHRSRPNAYRQFQTQMSKMRSQVFNKECAEETHQQIPLSRPLTVLAKHTNKIGSEPSRPVEKHFRLILVVKRVDRPFGFRIGQVLG